jgi:hypothetical protein
MREREMKKKIEAITTNCGISMKMESEDRVHGLLGGISKALQVYKVSRVPGSEYQSTSESAGTQPEW